MLIKETSLTLHQKIGKWIADYSRQIGTFFIFLVIFMERVLEDTLLAHLDSDFFTWIAEVFQIVLWIILGISFPVHESKSLILTFSAIGLATITWLCFFDPKRKRDEKLRSRILACIGAIALAVFILMSFLGVVGRTASVLHLGNPTSECDVFGLRLLCMVKKEN